MLAIIMSLFAHVLASDECSQEESWYTTISGLSGLQFPDPQTVTSYGAHAWHTTYGYALARSGVYEWTVELKSYSADYNSWGAMVGVSNQFNDYNAETFFTTYSNSPKLAYGYIAGTGEKTTQSPASGETYGSPWDSAGSKVTIRLDLNLHELSFALNGVDQGVAYHVDEGPYRFALSIYYTGVSISILCAGPVEPCDDLGCVNGDCNIDDSGSASCTCYDGFEGPTCSESSDPCKDVTCVNGDCNIDDSGSASCTCYDGFEGPTCSEQSDPCEDVTCVNGDCTIDDSGSASCTCYDGFEGPTCSQKSQVYFYYCSPVMNFEESRQYCESMEMQMASFSSEEEWLSLFGESGSIPCVAYAGGILPEKGGEWEWVNGEKWWQPDGNMANMGNDQWFEDKLAIRTNGKFVDWGRGEAKLGVLCMSPTNSAETLLGSEELTFSSQISKYQAIKLSLALIGSLAILQALATFVYNKVFAGDFILIQTMESQTESSA